MKIKMKSIFLIVIKII